jgi:hypothetical protein
MKSIIYSVVVIFTLVCITLAQQAPDSVAYDSNPSSLQLRAQKGTNNTVTLTWRGEPTSPGFGIYESTRQGYWTEIAIVGPNVASYTQSGLLDGVTYFLRCVTYFIPRPALMRCACDSRTRTENRRILGLTVAHVIEILRLRQVR